MGGPSWFIEGLWCRSDAKFPLQSSPSGQQQRLWPLPAAVRGEFFEGKETGLTESDKNSHCNATTALHLSRYISGIFKMVFNLGKQ